jgi:hypothetical protein
MRETTNRFGQMREFVIEVELPEGKTLNGFIPFEPVVNSKRGRFRIHATSYEEAQKLLSDYLNR